MLLTSPFKLYPWRHRIFRAIFRVASFRFHQMLNVSKALKGEMQRNTIHPLTFLHADGCYITTGPSTNLHTYQDINFESIPLLA